MKHLKTLLLTCTCFIGITGFTQHFKISSGLTLSEYFERTPVNYTFSDYYKLQPNAYLKLGYEFFEGKWVSFFAKMHLGGFGQRIVIDLTANNFNEIFDRRLNVHFINLDLNPQFNISLNEDMKIMLDLGPYAGFAILGYVKEKRTETNGEKISKDFEWIRFGENYVGKRFDFGLTGNITYQWKTVFVEAGYFYGLNNLNSMNSNYELYNRSMRFGLGIVL